MKTIIAAVVIFLFIVILFGPGLAFLGG